MLIQAVSCWLILACTVHIIVSFMHLVFKFIQFIVAFHFNVNQSRCSVSSKHLSFIFIIVFVETILVSYSFCNRLDMLNLIFSNFLDFCFTSFVSHCLLSGTVSFTNCWLLRPSPVLTKNLGQIGSHRVKLFLYDLLVCILLCFFTLLIIKHID